MGYFGSDLLFVGIQHMNGNATAARRYRISIGFFHLAIDLGPYFVGFASVSWRSDCIATVQWQYMAARLETKHIGEVDIKARLKSTPKPEDTFAFPTTTD